MSNTENILTLRLKEETLARIDGIEAMVSEMQDRLNAANEAKGRAQAERDRLAEENKRLREALESAAHGYDIIVLEGLPKTPQSVKLLTEWAADARALLAKVRGA